jgi:hypothetical protein
MPGVDYKIIAANSGRSGLDFPGAFELHSTANVSTNLNPDGSVKPGLPNYGADVSSSLSIPVDSWATVITDANKLADTWSSDVNKAIFDRGKVRDFTQATYDAMKKLVQNDGGDKGGLLDGLKDNTLKTLNALDALRPLESPASYYATLFDMNDTAVSQLDSVWSAVYADDAAYGKVFDQHNSDLEPMHKTLCSLEKALGI